MFVEALRFIVVIGVVIGANRLTSSNPTMLGSLSRQNAALIVTVLGAAIGYIAGGVLARSVDRVLKGAEEHVARHHASEIVAATLGILVGCLASAIVAWPILIYVHPEYVAFGSAAFLTLIVLSFTARLAVRKRLELFGVLGV